MISYEQDFYGWTQEQAGLLRAGRLTDLDVDNILEEIEAMGRSERRELQSRLTVLLVHLLKWQYQPARRGTSWELTIKTQRIDYMDVMKDNPGLKPKLSEIFQAAYDLARLKAAKESGLQLVVFPESCPWTYAQVIDLAFIPD